MTLGFRFLILLLGAGVLGGCQIHDAMVVKLNRMIEPAEGRFSPDVPDDVPDDVQDDVQDDVPDDVPDEDIAMDPLTQHLLARRQVDPTQISGPRPYTIKVQTGTKRASTAVPPHPAKKPAHVVPATTAVQKEKPAHVVPATTAVQKEKPRPKTKKTYRALGVRTGEYPGRARLVLDLDGPAILKYALDNDKHILAIQLLDTAWGAATEKTFPSTHPLFETYTVYTGRSGESLLVMKLKEETKVLGSAALKPKDGVPNHRLVFDFATN